MARRLFEAYICTVAETAESGLRLESPSWRKFVPHDKIGFGDDPARTELHGHATTPDRTPSADRAAPKSSAPRIPWGAASIALPKEKWAEARMTENWTPERAGIRGSAVIMSLRPRPGRFGAGCRSGLDRSAGRLRPACRQMVVPAPRGGSGSRAGVENRPGPARLQCHQRDEVARFLVYSIVVQVPRPDTAINSSGQLHPES